MRWATVEIVIFIITGVTIDCLAVTKLYNNVTANTVKKNLFFLDVVKLRFDNYLRDFNKSYSDEEYMRRFDNFKASLKNIARLNRLENNTVFGLTKFSDMSKQEFVDRMLLKPDNRPPCQNRQRDCTDLQKNYEPLIDEKYRNDIPSSFDWRKKGVVKPVLNQKMCQGCWAFSIVGVLESMSAIELNDNKSRSIQELLDCSPGTKGCNRGNVVTAMNFICNIKLQFVTEEEYPMTLSIDQICKLPKAGYYSGRRVTRFQHFCDMNEGLMVKYTALHGPLVVAVDATNWMNYIGGVITRACTRGISNHVVQIVGYEGYRKPDEETPIPYYIVRNSFGEDFGDHGYVKVAMEQVVGEERISDVCGIAEQVTVLGVI